MPHSRRDDSSVLAVLRSPRLLLRESLAGLVVALALIPEAISFAIIAGVDPRVGLYSSFVMGVAIAFLGGRPAMITASTAAVALVVAPVAREHGLDYLIATVLLGGVLQIVMAVLGVAKLMRFVPRSVMVGFLNSLALLMLSSQIPHVIEKPWMVYVLIGIALVIMAIWPRITKTIPAPLVAIIVVTVITVLANIAVPTVGDQGELPRAFPTLFIPDVPLTFETLGIIAPYAFAMAVVGLLESLIAAKLVDEVTDTRSDKTRESWGQGGANILSGLLGGMGGCAVIGQTMMNVKVAGARSRVSTFLSGAFLLVLVLLLSDVVAVIPMAALVAVMIVVAIATVDWHSLKPSTLRRMPKSETAVMFLTMAGVLGTGNLAVGAVIGVLTAMVLFARRVAHFQHVTRAVLFGANGEPESVRYTVQGALFFASSNDLTNQFEYAEDPNRVVIDLSASHIWDASSVAALDAIAHRYAKRGKTVEVVGMNEASARMHARLAGGFGLD